MGINETRKRFQDKRMTGYEYIHDMHSEHSLLFEYADFIKDSAIAKVEITDEGIVMTDREYGIRMLCDRQDERAIPMETLNPICIIWFIHNVSDDKIESVASIKE